MPNARRCVVLESAVSCSSELNCASCAIICAVVLRRSRILMRQLRGQQLQERVAAQSDPFRFGVSTRRIRVPSDAGSLRNQVLLLCADSRSAATWRNVASPSICFCSSAAAARGPTRACALSRKRSSASTPLARLLRTPPTPAPRHAPAPRRPSRTRPARAPDEQSKTGATASVRRRSSRASHARPARAPRRCRASASARTRPLRRANRSDARASTRRASSYSRCARSSAACARKRNGFIVRAPPTGSTASVKPHRVSAS